MRGAARVQDSVRTAARLRCRPTPTTAHACAGIPTWWMGTYCFEAWCAARTCGRSTGPGKHSDPVQLACRPTSPSLAHANSGMLQRARSTRGAAHQRENEPVFLLHNVARAPLSASCHAACARTCIVGMRIVNAGTHTGAHAASILDAPLCQCALTGLLTAWQWSTCAIALHQFHSPPACGATGSA